MFYEYVSEGQSRQFITGLRNGDCDLVVQLSKPKFDQHDEFVIRYDVSADEYRIEYNDYGNSMLSPKNGVFYLDENSIIRTIAEETDEAMGAEIYFEFYGEY